MDKKRFCWTLALLWLISVFLFIEIPALRSKGLVLGERHDLCGLCGALQETEIFLSISIRKAIQDSEESRSMGSLVDGPHQHAWVNFFRTFDRGGVSCGRPREGQFQFSLWAAHEKFPDDSRVKQMALESSAMNLHDDEQFRPLLRRVVEFSRSDRP